MVSTTPTSQVDPGYVIGFCWSKDLGPKSASKSEPRYVMGRVSRLESVCVCVCGCVCVCVCVSTLAVLQNASNVWANVRETYMSNEQVAMCFSPRTANKKSTL